MSSNQTGHTFANLFAQAREPVVVVDEYGNTLYENPHACRLRTRLGLLCSGSHDKAVHEGSADDALTAALGPFREQIVALLRTPPLTNPNDPLHVRNHLINHRWLIRVSPVPRSLAVLHAVFVIRLISWRRLQHRATHALCMAFGLTEADRLLVATLSSQCTLDQMAQAMDVDDTTVLEHIRALYRKLGIESRSELWDLLHGLTKHAH